MRSHVTFVVLSLLVGALVYGRAEPAQAQDAEAIIAAHVRVIDKPDGQQSLQVDGRERHVNAILTLEQSAFVANVPVAIGLSGDGGNSCDAAPFVVSFPKGQKPRLDGPLSVCATVSREMKKNHILVSTAAIPGSHGQRWRWTPAKGFQPAGVVVHTPDRRLGWAKLRERKPSHPFDLFDYREVAAALDRLLKGDKRRFLTHISGPGDVEERGEMLVGQACPPHACADAGALVVVSLATKQIYVAWKPEDRAVVTRPAWAEWPPLAQDELTSWLAANAWEL
jgi:hypothetical protein